MWNSTQDPEMMSWSLIAIVLLFLLFLWGLRRKAFTKRGTVEYNYKLEEVINGQSVTVHHRFIHCGSKLDAKFKALSKGGLKAPVLHSPHMHDFSDGDSTRYWHYHVAGHGALLEDGIWVNYHFCFEDELSPRFQKILMQRRLEGYLAWKRLRGATKGSFRSGQRSDRLLNLLRPDRFSSTSHTG